MARPPILDGGQKKFIVKIKEYDLKENRTITSKEVIEAVRVYLLERCRSSLSNFTTDELNKIVIDEMLSPTAIISFLTGLNKRLKDKVAKEIDNEWTLETLKNKKWDFPPESVPYLLKIKEWHSDTTTHLSIRQALWVARLYVMPQYEPIKSGGLKAVKDRLTLPDETKYKDLWRIGYFLAAYDETCELSQTPFDYRPFEAPSIALMVKRSREYFRNHQQEMSEALWHAEIIGEGEGE